MANTSDIKNGLIINHKNGLWKVIEFLHVKPGKGGAFVRTKLKNVRTGQIIDETFRAGQKIETVRTHWPFFRDRIIDYYKGLLKNPQDD